MLEQLHSTHNIFSLWKASLTLYASGILTGSPLSATYPTIPVPHGIRISFFFSISCSVDWEHTSNSLETKHLEWQPWDPLLGVRKCVDDVLKVSLLNGRSMEPVLVDPIGEPTTTEPVFGDVILSGAVELVTISLWWTTAGVGEFFSMLRQPTGCMRPFSFFNESSSSLVRLMELLMLTVVLAAVVFIIPTGLLLEVSGAGTALRSPWTRNSELRSACSNVLTFCKILWHKERTSNSLQISLTWYRNNEQSITIFHRF